MTESQISPGPDPVSRARLRREFLLDTLSTLEDAYTAARLLGKKKDEDLRSRLERWSKILSASADAYGHSSLGGHGKRLTALLQASDAFPEAETLEVLDAVSRELSLVRKKKPQARPHAPPSEKTAESPFRRYRLLMIDDDPILRKIAKVALESAGGFSVRTLPGGEQAVETAAAEKPDLIILDAVMPGLDGFEVCQLLKSDKRTAEIPVVFLSADSREEDRAKARQAGSLGLIAKPFKSAALSSEILTLLKPKD